MTASSSALHPWDAPAYTAAMAGRLVGLRPERVRRWLVGYEYDYAAAGEPVKRRIKKAPVVHRESDETPFASFLDLIDLLFVKGFLDAGISLQKVRRALDEADALVGGHHFAQRSFFTDGRNVYLEVKKRASGAATSLLELLSGGQWVIAPVIKDLATEIKFHHATGFAERWYPLGPQTRVIVDPRVSFGAPTVLNRGIETANVFDLYIAERKQIDAVCSWLELQPEEVEDAVQFEQMLAAA
jgi:uncharacterized protein (DUF433 family)